MKEFYLHFEHWPINFEQIYLETIIIIRKVSGCRKFPWMETMLVQEYICLWVKN